MLARDCSPRTANISPWDETITSTARPIGPLFRSELDPAQLDEIRSAANGGFALGNDRFKAQIAQMLKRRVERGAPGRPRKDNPELSDTKIQAG